MKRSAKWCSRWLPLLGIAIAGCGLGDGTRALPDENVGEVTQAVTTTFTPGPTAKFVPPAVGSGDREFKGHGPFVQVDATLSVRNSTQLWATIHMHAIETKSDWTEADGSQDVMLWQDTLPIRVLSDVSSADSYTDTDHDDDTLSEPAGELVNHFICTGDTSGSEAGTKTGVRVFWNAITVEQIRDSCVNHCGGSSGACWCDSQCTQFGDCCADKCQVCGGC